MSEWAHPDPGAAPQPVAVDDGEPRAREVIEAARGRVPGYDPTLRWERAVPPASPPPTLVKPEMPRGERARVLRFEREAWLRFDPTTHEYNISPEVGEALLHNAPQWILRDLDRPRDQAPAMFEVRDEDRVLGTWDAALREAEKARILPARPHVTTAIEMIIEDQRRRSEFRAEPWLAVLPDDAPRRTVVLYGVFDSLQLV